MEQAVTSSFSAEDFRRRASGVTHAHEDDEFGDHRLNPDLRDMIVRPGLRDAAVLIPVVAHDEGATVILTQRTEALRSHSGQIAFPGGKIDPEDGSAIATIPDAIFADRVPQPEEVYDVIETAGGR